MNISRGVSTQGAYSALPRVPLQRDVKGLYKLVDEGKIKGFTGVDDPYEEPEHPELIVETDKETLDESVDRIFSKLVELGYLAPTFLNEHKTTQVATHPHN